MTFFVFDADGTMRRSTVFGQPCPHAPEEWELLPNVRAKLATIDWNQHRFGIVSNQSGVSLGLLTHDMAARLLLDCADAALARPPDLHTILFCPHLRSDACACRKPKPTLLQQLQKGARCSPDEMVFVGDLPTDEEAASAAGCRFQWAHTFFGWTVEDRIRWQLHVCGEMGATRTEIATYLREPDDPTSGGSVAEALARLRAQGDLVLRRRAPTEALRWFINA